MSLSFAEALTIVGGLLVGVAAASGLTHRSVLSTAVLAVAAGIGLALAGVVELSPGAYGLVLLVELVLLVTLFSDGLLVEEELLRSALAPRRAGARDRDADHGGAARARRQAAVPRADLGRGVPARLRPRAHRPVVTSSVVASPRSPPACATPSTSNPGSTTASRCRSCCSSSSSPARRRAAPPSRPARSALETVIGLAVGAALAWAAGRALDALPAVGARRALRGALRARPRPRSPSASPTCCTATG